MHPEVIRRAAVAAQPPITEIDHFAADFRHQEQLSGSWFSFALDVHFRIVPGPRSRSQRSHRVRLLSKSSCRNSEFPSMLAAVNWCLSDYRVIIHLRNIKLRFTALFTREIAGNRRNKWKEVIGSIYDYQYDITSQNRNVDGASRNEKQVNNSHFKPLAVSPTRRQLLLSASAVALFGVKSHQRQGGRHAAQSA